MTREEAIARIKNHKIAHKMNEPRAIYISEALDMAIEALEQEPCEDAISREATLKPYKGLNDEDTISVWLIRKNIEQQPPVKPQELYKGMTNREVLEAVFPNIDFCIKEFDGSIWVDMEDIASFRLDWWNSLYEPQENEDKE